MEPSCLHDYYEILGIPPEAASEEIGRAFRKLSLQYHPDKHPGSESHYQPIFVKIRNAYEVLQDTKNREEHNKICRRSTKTPGASWTSSCQMPSSSMFNQPRTQREEAQARNAALREQFEKQRRAAAEKEEEERKRRLAEQEQEAQRKLWEEEWEYLYKWRHEAQTDAEIGGRLDEDLKAVFATEDHQADHDVFSTRVDTFFAWEPPEIEGLFTRVAPRPETTE